MLYKLYVHLFALLFVVSSSMKMMKGFVLVQTSATRLRLWRHGWYDLQSESDEDIRAPRWVSHSGSVSFGLFPEKDLGSDWWWGWPCPHLTLWAFLQHCFCQMSFPSFPFGLGPELQALKAWCRIPSDACDTKPQADIGDRTWYHCILKPHRCNSLCCGCMNVLIIRSVSRRIKLLELKYLWESFWALLIMISQHG